jgi:hypothetical protein
MIRIAKNLGIGIASVTLIGCATSSGTAGLECGAGGLAAAYLACTLAHGSAAKCAAIGAGVGGAAGLACYAYANHLDARRKELAGNEQNLDAQIRYVRGLNQDTQQLNTQLAQRVSTVTQDTTKLVAQIGQQQISQQQLAKERKSRDDIVKSAQNDVNQGTQALQTAKDLRAQQKRKSPDLDNAISQQEALLAQAQHQVDLLAAQRALIS